MFLAEGGRPGDRRGFVHKSFIGRAIGGVAKKLISATPIGAAISTGVNIARSVIRPPTRPVAPRSVTARPSLAGAQGKALGRELKFGGDTFPTVGVSSAFPVSVAPGTPCTHPAFRDPSTGLCVTKGTDFISKAQQFFPGGKTGFIPTPTQPVGDAVMGQYGAALQPGVMMIERSVCLPGMQLAKDGLCYNKGAITNSQRMWPRGRRPLLTGGDMRAISIAARAGSKLDRTTKRLRALGMMKALPRPRKGAPHAHAKPVAAVSV